ncbi:carotenoid oxygenase family protein [Thermomonospora amylolytica]|uniref:carotenoid oxygenase family protein n=1 Tax=Thermomonospora amylolytica TaxID=1411117 RepID=UPI0013003506|nr:carotenoid oxygenase family protein [Thermomonospora amylolytica]
MAVLARDPDPGHAPGDEPLPVVGELPEGLHGCLLQAATHPLAAGPGVPHGHAGPHVFHGIRLEGGVARWHRAALPVRRHRPFGPVPALAPTVWAPDAAGGDEPAYITLARPVRTAGSAEWHTVAAYPGLGHAEHLVAGPDGGVLRARPFALDGAPLMHAVALTRRYVVVLDLPVVHHRAAALVGARFPYAWRPGRPARIGLLPRDPGEDAEPRWFPIEPCYVFDVVNAYDDGGTVVLDAVRHARAFDDPDPGAVPPPRVHRWTLDLDTGAVADRAIPQAGRTAVVDERVFGHRHRYLFGLTGGAADVRLCRHDLRTGVTTVRGLGGGPVSRPLFVPDAGRAAEGAGWVVVLTEDPARRRGHLLAFDALDIAGPPRAVVRLPLGLPVTRRAVWLPGHPAPVPGPDRETSADRRPAPRRAPAEGEGPWIR